MKKMGFITIKLDRIYNNLKDFLIIGYIRDRVDLALNRKMLLKKAKFIKLLFM